MAGYYGFTFRHPCVCQSIHPSVSQSYVRPSVFRFQMITWVNINGFSRNLVCALKLWRSGLGLLMGKFRQSFMELPACNTIMAGYCSLTFLLTSSDLQTCPGAKFLHHCILLFITFNLICNMTIFLQSGFWTLWGHTPGPAPRGYIKIPYVFCQSLSKGLLPVTVSRF